MLTNNDLLKLKKLLATKQDLKKIEQRLGNLETTSASKKDTVTFKDEILHEIKGLREEVTLVIGYKDQIEDHETRIETIEKRLRITQ